MDERESSPLDHSPHSAGDAESDSGLSRPEWDDEYLDRVADRLMGSYDLERDRRINGERFEMAGQLEIERQKQFFHQSLNYGNHRVTEHLFVRRTDRVSRADLESLVERGHTLAERWIDPDETHFATEFTFVLISPEISHQVREFVSGFKDRTLLKLGYYGHYELNLTVIAPDEEDSVGSTNADVERAFNLWDDLEGSNRDGLLSRLRSRLG